MKELEEAVRLLENYKITYGKYPPSNVIVDGMVKRAKFLKTHKSKVKENELLHDVSGSFFFTPKDMMNFASKMHMLGNPENKEIKELLKDFCENDR